MLAVEGIYKSYGKLPVLKGVSFQIQQGSIVGITGPSGAGKSTLLQIAGTLDIPDKGKVLFDRVDLTSLTEKAISKFRNQNMGFIFQAHHLLAEFTALENVCIPGFIGNNNTEAVKEQAINLLSKLGLSERLHHKPAELSGGEAQRTAVARALINSPKIVFADEPSGNLDSQTANELHNLFFSLREELGTSFLIVTHNETLAERCDLRLRMKDGLLA